MSDLFKDISLKTRTKDSTFKAKARTNDSNFQGLRTKAKDNILVYSHPSKYGAV